MSTPEQSDSPVIEVGWEVCNRVGGIYTVLRTKAPQMVAQHGDRYAMVGPLNASAAQVEFEDTDVPAHIAAGVAALTDAGVHCRAGRWLVQGRPLAVLIDLESLRAEVPALRQDFERRFGLVAKEDDGLACDALAFGKGVRTFARAVAQHDAATPMVLHMHEWQAAAVLPMLSPDDGPIKTVFTTHATLLGRFMAGDLDRAHERFDRIHPAEQAAHYGIAFQHGMESLAAQQATAFTTVSSTTARECSSLLGREPDVLLPNGINTKRFEVIHEFQGLHQHNKNRLHEFTRGYFFPSYEFDLDQTLYFVNSGRFEFRNKGMDMCLDALARLNERLKVTSSPRTVVFFLITNRPVRSLSVGSLQYRSMFQEMQSIAKKMASEVEDELIGELVAGRIPDLNRLVQDPTRLRLRRALHAWRRDWLPPIVTHDLMDDATDPVLEKLRSLNLINLEEDRVKVVYHPQFVDSTNPLLGMEYEDLIRGCHLGVFPSAYEPWGYTPLECLAMGVPAVTSNLAGFGTYASNLKNETAKHGLYVVDRDRRPYREATEQLAEHLFTFAAMSRRERVAQRNRAEQFAQQFDWKHLVHHYHRAHSLVLQ